MIKKYPDDSNFPFFSIALFTSTNVQKLDVPCPDEKFCLCWLCAFTKFSSGGAIFPVHLIFERLYLINDKWFKVTSLLARLSVWTQGGMVRVV